MSRCFRIGFVLFAGGALFAQQRLEITLERLEGSTWSSVAPGLVFAKGDELRFRVRTNFDGYLYVSDLGTSGRYLLLFPREETGLDNQVKAGVEYVVPATKAAFKIDGPPGHDIVYWMVSPVFLGAAPLPPPPKQVPAAPNMTPRCDDTIYRARSICIDSSAGPRNITAQEKLPDNLEHVPRATSRDLVILSNKDQSVISSPVPLTGPVLYEFRVAHE